MNFLLIILAYIKHLFRAKTLHGTHSPFVYKLLEKAVYNRESMQYKLPSEEGIGCRWRQKRCAQVLAHIVHFMGYRRVVNSPSALSVKADMIYLTQLDETSVCWIEGLNQGGMLAYRGITIKSEYLKQIFAHPRVQVYIDLFFLHLFFVDRTQAKEVFEIKLK